LAWALALALALALAWALALAKDIPACKKNLGARMSAFSWKECISRT